MSSLYECEMLIRMLEISVHPITKPVCLGISRLYAPEYCI